MLFRWLQLGSEVASGRKFSVLLLFGKVVTFAAAERGRSAVGRDLVGSKRWGCWCRGPSMLKGLRRKGWVSVRGQYRGFDNPHGHSFRKTAVEQEHSHVLDVYY